MASRGWFDSSMVSFALIGALNTLLNWAIMLVLFANMGLSKWMASAVGYALTGALSFVLNRRFSFHSRGALWGDLLRFVIVFAACYLLGNQLAFSVVGRLLEWPVFAGIAKWSGQIQLLCGNLVFTVLNYFGQRFFAFNKEGK